MTPWGLSLTGNLVPRMRSGDRAGGSLGTRFLSRVGLGGSPICTYGLGLTLHKETSPSQARAARGWTKRCSARAELLFCLLNL